MIVIILVLAIVLIRSRLARNHKLGIVEDFKSNPLLYVNSTLDNLPYLVENYDGKEDASQLLSIVNSRLRLLASYLCVNANTYPQYKPYILQFCKKIKHVTYQETPIASDLTSYTINKQRVSLCLRSKDNYQFHDINLIMYVAIHEIAHVACPQVHHTPLFKEIFIFILKISVALGIYEPVNYEIEPASYCGINIRENLLNHQ